MEWLALPVSTDEREEEQGLQQEDHKFKISLDTPWDPISNPRDLGYSSVVEQVQGPGMDPLHLERGMKGWRENE